MFYHLGLTGFPLGHSLSPKLHAAALQSAGIKGEYRLYPVSPDDPNGLPELINRLRAGKLQGLNVTIPYKQAVIPLVDELTPSALAIGAVNTLFLKDGKLIGHNTDAPGFLVDLERVMIDLSIVKKALVMGAGGAARAIVHALLTTGWDVRLAVRREDVGQAGALMEAFRQPAGSRSLGSVLLEVGEMRLLLGEMQLIVNATPIGMFPETENSPWPAGLSYPEGATVYDLVYNPRQTLLVRFARAAGLRAVNGSGMLVEQAALSFCYWTGQEADRKAMFEALEA
jgi:shikimate dehydrogenase